MVNISNYLEISTLVTFLICSIILIISLLGIFFRRRVHNQGKPIGPVTTLAPSAAISLGIFGTFLGIFLGLRNFDVLDINNSIPDLLEGLKTAFFTSLFGMSFSLILKYIYSIYDKKDIKVESVASDDPTILLRQIAKNVSSLSDTVNSIGKMIISCFRSDEEYSIFSHRSISKTGMND